MTCVFIDASQSMYIPKSRAADGYNGVTGRSVSVPMTLCDPEWRDVRNQIFRWISLITLESFDAERQHSTV